MSILSMSQLEIVRADQANHDGGLAAFNVASKSQSNARNCKIKRLVVDFQPIEEVDSACSVIFGAVDRDDTFQCRIARDAWLLKTTLMLTVLPFDDARLNLTELVISLEQAAGSVPEIMGQVNRLRRMVDALRREPANPKREQVLEIIQIADQTREPLAMVANLRGSTTPGWPADIDDQNDLGGHGITIVRTRKDVRDSFFSRIIVPGNPKFVPRKILFDLLYGGRSSEIIVTCYRSEHAWIPYLSSLPPDRLFAGTRPTDSNAEQVHVVEATPDSRIEQWAQESFWDSIRARHGDVGPTSDRDVSVRARFVLFADGSGAFLPEDRRVVEISASFDLGQELDEAADRLPRKSVFDLDEGDLVMMRLSGSGDYLDDVADTLMKQAGEDNLRIRALDWKDWLSSTLKQHGEGVLASRLRKLNIALRSAHYLWSWAGEEVMAPHDLVTFQNLIRVIHELNPTPEEINVNEYALAKWNEMELVKAYHHKAGAVIRAALVTRVRDLIIKRERVDTVLTIELPGVRAGKMGLLRVSAVDEKAMQVPLSRLFHLEKVIEQ